MTTYMRWRTGTQAQYEYFEVGSLKWVPCEREMYAYFLSRGPVHMNPRADPVVALAVELRRAA